MGTPLNSNGQPAFKTSLPGRRLPVGAELHPDGGIHFRVWAPAAKRLFVRFAQARDLAKSFSEIELLAESGGYFSGVVKEAKVGDHYKFVLESGAFPDPVSRFQPDGPHGASRIVEPSSYSWTDKEWRGIPEVPIIYELHIGTFTQEGTWAAATKQLAELADLGINVIELLPVADFPGNHGWGYDGVNLFAPTRLYGEPDEFRAFVDCAHSHGIAVILDVVYNHFGPDGNYIKQFSPHYISERYKNEWGEAINFDDEHSGPVREFFLSNAGYWIDEYHLDGLRLDATQQIFDESKEHILAAITRRVRETAPLRKTYLVAENESQNTELVRSVSQGGYGMDSVWNDDFHHSAIVALTGRNEAYYTDYEGGPQEFISAAKWGFIYQGQRYRWQKKRRGTPGLDLKASNFVTFIQNHDQIANSLWGRRIHALTSPSQLRAMTALLLLGPGTPMLFQGQEFAASTPFYYFADHNPELALLVAKGRKEFLKQFPSIAQPASTIVLQNPERRETFLSSKLRFEDRIRFKEIYLLHRDLIHLRKSDPLLSNAQRGNFDGAVLGKSAFLLRFFGTEGDDRLLIINLGKDLHLDPAPDPLLAPVANCEWKLVWSSEDPRYGGNGTPPVDSEENWKIPAFSAVLLSPIKALKI
ncbi:MAG: 1,4-alpha-glucan branching protein [Chthoniobacteraceae bacterium]|nr:1,4-alpha-glucan branching protein [Chthoniobacteraceae bacterium]